MGDLERTDAGVGPVDLAFSGRWLPLSGEGLGVYSRSLLEGLQVSGRLRVRVLVPAHEASACSWLPADWVVPVPGSRVQGKQLVEETVWNWRLAVAARRLFPKAIYHSPYDFWCPFSPRNFVTTVHDAIPEREGESAGGLLRRFLRRRALGQARRARCILTDSESSARDLVAFRSIPEGMIRILYPWVRPAFLQTVSDHRIQEVRARYSLPDRFILYSGGYRPYKNADALVRAWAAVRSRASLPPLVFAGKVPRNTGLHCRVHEEVERLRLGPEAVHFPGFIATEDLPAVFRAATLFVSPSRCEGFGLPLAEALACGTPVLAADASSYPELVPDPRLRFPPDSTEVLAAKLMEACRNPADFRAPLNPLFTEQRGAERYARLMLAAGSAGDIPE